MNANEEKEEVLIVRVTMYEYLILSALLIQVLELLNMRDLGRVDSCNTNIKLRPQYLRRLREMREYALFYPIIKPNNEGMIIWTSLRGIKVEKLSFELWTNITDEDFIKIIKLCPLLHSIYINWCRNITDIGIVALSNGCPLLRNIFIYWSGKVTDTSLIGLGNGCPLLENVNLTMCRHISNSGIIKLSEGCPWIRNITLDGCNNCRFTDENYRNLLHNCPCIEGDEFDRFR